LRLINPIAFHCLRNNNQFGNFKGQVIATYFFETVRAFSFLLKINVQFFTRISMDSIRGDCAPNSIPKECIGMSTIIRLDFHAAHFRRRGKPRWDAATRQLWFNGQLVKQFKRPAFLQELILAAFEEQGWPDCIDDPLSGQLDQDPKGRLHDTIKRLNRHHRCRAISFHGNGTGQGIIWKRLEKTASGPR
jgi:hypothetical protein